MRSYKPVWCLLCSIALLPATALATTYSQITAAIGNHYQIQVIGLGASDGYAYLPVWQDTGGTWHQAGILPGQNTRFSQLIAFTGPTGIDIAALGRNGLAYVAAHQNPSNGVWNGGIELPQNGTVYSQLGVFSLNALCTNNQPTSEMEVVGMGASDHLVHAVAYEDCSGNWHEETAILEVTPLTSVYMEHPDVGGVYGGITGGSIWGIANNGTTLIQATNGGEYYQSIPFTSLDLANGVAFDTNNTLYPCYYGCDVLGVSGGNPYLVYTNGTSETTPLPYSGVGLTKLTAAQGNSQYLQVWGLGTDGYGHIVAYQKNGGWYSVGSVPTYQAQISDILAINGQPGSDLQILGLGTNGHVELISWQNNSSGTWAAGGDLTP